MPALAAIKVANSIDLPNALLKSLSASVGVTTTLSPDGFSAPGVQKWVDRSGGIQVGYPWLTISVRRPTRESRLTRVTVKLGLPTLATTAPTTSTGIQPAPEKAYEHLFIGEWFLPERGTLAEREQHFCLILSLFLTTITASDGTPSDDVGSPLHAAVADLEPTY